MPFPDGVTLCEVQLPASAVWQGGASTINVTLTPTRNVFHRKTGELLAPVTGSATGPSGPGLKLLVPHTQQSNYRDAKGNSVGAWEYELLATYRDTANVAQTLRKQLRIPRGTTSLNLLSAIDYEPSNELSAVAGDGVPRFAFDTDGTPYFV
jgi:hypothetical protein